MPEARLNLLIPPEVSDFLPAGSLAGALQSVARLADARLRIDCCEPGSIDAEASRGKHVRAITYQDQATGWIDADRPVPSLLLAVDAIQSFLEHAIDRERAIADFSEQLFSNYEELNLIYQLLPAIATRCSEQEIGDLLVQRTAETLQCDRVSLLVLDEDQVSLRLLAASGLPADIGEVVIPITDSMAGRVLTGDDPFLTGDMSQRPDLRDLSRGRYEKNAFALVRVPLRARGDIIGVLTATERRTGDEFTTRDRKLLESLSAMGASALMHCRLQASLHQQMLSTIKALALAVDAKDHYTHDHSNRVSMLCMMTAREMDISEETILRHIELAGLLHDIGKIGIPDSILTKTGPLTSEEYEVIKRHVQIGAQIVGKVNGLQDVAEAILHHHERHDGLGYPKGLTADEVPLASRLIAIADTFDSMTSDRVYRKAASWEAAFRELRVHKGTQFAPEVVEAFETVYRRQSETTAGSLIDSPAPAI